MQFVWNYCELEMQMCTTFIKNEIYEYSQVNIWKHSKWQKKHCSTHENIGRPASMKTGEAWNGLYSVGGGGGGDDDRS